MSRTDFIRQWRGQLQNPNTREFSSEQVERWLNLSLEEYSRFKPRKDCQSTLVITTGDSRVPLPLTWIDNQTNRDALSKTTIDLSAPQPTTILVSPNYYYAMSSLDFVPQLQKPITPTPFVVRIETMTVDTDQRPRYAIILDYVPTESATIQINYVGLHQIEDANGVEFLIPINTLSTEGREKVFLRMEASRKGFLAEYYSGIAPERAKQYAQMSQSDYKEFKRNLLPLGI